MLCNGPMSDPGFSVFNVGWGRETSVNDIVDSLRRACSEGELADRFKGGLKVEHGPPLAGEQRRSVIDPGKIQRELGWKPEVELREGLALTIHSFLRP